MNVLDWPADPAAPNCIRRRPRGATVNAIVIHTMEGTFEGTRAWFQKGDRDVPTAAHYLIGRAGHILQMVPDASMCFHARGYNGRSIGIEHEGYASNTTWPNELLDASARVVAALCRKFAIPADRTHILGHVEVPGATHTDPGAHWPWDHYMARIRAHLDENGTQAPVV